MNDLSKYQVAIGSTCPWNAEQLQVADRVINPPIVVQHSTVVRQIESLSGNSAAARVELPLTPVQQWNNCNGIQEAGESYSARCETAQEMNDAGQGNDWSERVDNRPHREFDPGWNPRRQGPANGYSGNN